jgi:hypothetical protein
VLKVAGTYCDAFELEIDSQKCPPHFLFRIGKGVVMWGIIPRGRSSFIATTEKIGEAV